MNHARPSREVRTFLGTAEIRGDKAAADLGPSEAIPVTGHAAVFGQRTTIGSPAWGFVEVIDARAFDDVLQDDARYLINHDPNRVMARVASGTLRLATDKVGLVSDADLAPVSYARDLAILMERQDVTQMSFAFQVAPDGEEWSNLDEAEAEAAGLTHDHPEMRTITRVSRLYDVSAVTYPAYEGADVALRAAEEILGPRPKVGRPEGRRDAILLEARRTETLLRVRMDAAYAGRPI